jgi:hypothetical protein
VVAARGGEEAKGLVFCNVLNTSRECGHNKQGATPHVNVSSATDHRDHPGREGGHGPLQCLAVRQKGCEESEGCNMNSRWHQGDVVGGGQGQGRSPQAHLWQCSGCPGGVGVQGRNLGGWDQRESEMSEMHVAT